VFVVGYLGDWKPAAKVLFESESLRRDIKKSKIKGQEIAGTITARFGNSRNNHEELAPTLTSSYGKSSGQDMQPGLIQPVYSSEKSATLTSSAAGFSRSGQTSTAHENYVAYSIQGSMVGRNDNAGPNGNGINKEISFTLNTTDRHNVAFNMGVRRLTEIECERLQGFPDNYTNIKDNCPSGARYKALGNSMAVPVMKWIGQRINELS